MLPDPADLTLPRFGNGGEFALKKVLYILFHRSVVVGMSLLAQVVTLIVMVSVFSGYTQTFYWCCIAVSVVAAMLILGSSIDPAYKIAWLLVILPFPVFGGIFYLFIGGGRVSSRRQRRMQGIWDRSIKALAPDFKADDLLPLGGEAATQATYLEQRAACPAYTNTVAEYFSLGDLAFPRMLAELGASFVKTYYCDDFEKVVAACPVPIVIAGGKKLPEDEALTMAYRAISDGARGVDMGRNIFQSEHPAAMCRAVAKIVHEKFTDREAFQFYQELAAQDN